jgi:hypothetical protein
MVDEVLKREDCINKGIIPTGRKFGVFVDGSSSFYWVRFADGKGGQVPNELSGAFTGKVRADDALREYVKRFWDISENASKKSRANADSR